jgi:hypothetical protein
MSNEPSPGSARTISQTVGRGRTATLDDSAIPKLALPQHQYCKPETGQENKSSVPTGKYFKAFCI